MILKPSYLRYQLHERYASLIQKDNSLGPSLNSRSCRQDSQSYPGNTYRLVITVPLLRRS